MSNVSFYWPKALEDIVNEFRVMSEHAEINVYVKPKGNNQLKLMILAKGLGSRVMYIHTSTPINVTQVLARIL